MDTMLHRLPPPTVCRAMRQAAGLTQAEIAHQLGVTRETVSRWETGARRPRRSNRKRYATLLDRLREHVGLPA